MKTVGYIFASISGVTLLLSLMFGLTWMGIEWRGFFGPKSTAVEREIFYETRSYNEGMIQQLSRYRLEYLRADEESDRTAIASTVRVMFAEYDSTELKPELRKFLGECGL